MFNLKKFTAVLVSLCLFITTLTELSYSSIGIFNDKDINVEGSIFNGFKTVDSSYKSDSHLLIIINDLHSNPGVQKSIYTFLNKLNAFNSLSKVFVEGAPYGEIKLLNTTYDIEGKNKRKIIDIMLSSGLISGAEVFGINNNFNKMYGIEQWDKYVENIQIAAKNYAKNDEDNFLTSIKESIYFNSKPEIKNIIDKILQVSDLDSGLKENILKIYRDNKDFSAELRKYDEINKYLKIIYLEKKLKDKNIEKEFNQLERFIKNNIPYSEYINIIGNYSEGNTDELFRHFYEFLKKRFINVFFVNTALSEFLYAQELKHSLDLNKLLSQIELFRNNLINTAESPYDKENIQMYFYADLLSKYVKLDISEKEFIYIQKNKDAILETSYRLLNKQEYLKLSKILLDDSIIKYYENNLKRNEIFYKNILNIINHHRSDETVSFNGKEYKSINVAVIGGFHGDVAKLIEKDMSHITLMPTIDDHENGFYKNAISLAASSLSSSLAPPLLSTISNNEINNLVEYWSGFENIYSRRTIKSVNNWFSQKGLPLKIKRERKNNLIIKDISETQNQNIFKKFFGFVKSIPSKILNRNMPDEIYQDRTRESVVLDEYLKTIDSLNGQMPDIVVVCVNDEEEVKYYKNIVRKMKRNMPPLEKVNFKFIHTSDSGTGASFIAIAEYIDSLKKRIRFKNIKNKKWSELKICAVNIDGIEKSKVMKELPFYFNGNKITSFELSILNGVRACQSFGDKGGLALMDPENPYIGTMKPEGDITIISSMKSYDDIVEDGSPWIISKENLWHRTPQKIYYDFNIEKISSKLEKKGILDKTYNIENKKLKQFETTTGNILFNFEEEDAYSGFWNQISELYKHIYKNKTIEERPPEINFIKHILIPLVRMKNQEDSLSYFAKIGIDKELGDFYEEYSSFFDSYLNKDLNEIIKIISIKTHKQPHSLYMANLKSYEMADYFAEHSQVSEKERNLPSIPITAIDNELSSSLKDEYNELFQQVLDTRLERVRYDKERVNMSKIYKSIVQKSSENISRINKYLNENENIPQSLKQELDNIKKLYIALEYYSLEYLNTIDSFENISILGGYIFPKSSIFERLKIMPFNRRIFGMHANFHKEKNKLRKQAYKLYILGNNISSSMYDYDTLLNGVNEFIDEKANPSEKTYLGIEKRWTDRKAIQRILSIFMAVQSVISSFAVAYFNVQGNWTLLAQSNVIGAVLFSFFTGLGLSIFLHRTMIFLGKRNSFYKQNLKRLSRENKEYFNNLYYMSDEDNLLDAIMTELRKITDENKGLKNETKKIIALIKRYKKTRDKKIFYNINSGINDISNKLPEASLKTGLDTLNSFLPAKIYTKTTQQHTLAKQNIVESSQEYLKKWESVLKSGDMDINKIEIIRKYALQIIKTTVFSESSFSSENKERVITILQDFMLLYNATIDKINTMPEIETNKAELEIRSFEEAGEYAQSYYKMLSYALNADILNGYRISEGAPLYFLETFKIMPLVRTILGINFGIYASEKGFFGSLSNLIKSGNFLIPGLYDEYKIMEFSKKYFDSKRNPKKHYIGINEFWKIRKMLTRTFPLLFFVRKVIVSGAYTDPFQFLVAFISGLGILFSMHWIPIVYGLLHTKIHKNIIKRKLKKGEKLELFKPFRSDIIENRILEITQSASGPVPDIVFVSVNSDNEGINDIKKLMERIMQNGNLKNTKIEFIINRNHGDGNALMDVFYYMNSEEYALKYPDLVEKGLSETEAVVLNIDGLNYKDITDSIDFKINNEPTTPLELSLLNAVSLIQNSSKKGNIIIADPSYLYFGALKQTGDITLLSADSDYDQIRSQNLPVFIAGKIGEERPGQSLLNKVYKTLDLEKVHNIILKDTLENILQQKGEHSDQVSTFSGLLSISMDDRKMEEFSSYIIALKNFIENYDGKKFKIDFMNHIMIPYTMLNNGESIDVYLAKMMSGIDDMEIRSDYNKFFSKMFEIHKDFFNKDKHSLKVNMVMPPESMLTKASIGDEYYNSIKYFIEHIYEKKVASSEKPLPSKTALKAIETVNYAANPLTVSTNLSNQITLKAAEKKKTLLFMMDTLSTDNMEHIKSAAEAGMNSISMVLENDDESFGDESVIIDVPIEDTVISAKVMIKESKGKSYILKFMPLYSGTLSDKEHGIIKSILSGEYEKGIDAVRKRVFFARATLSLLKEAYYEREDLGKTGEILKNALSDNLLSIISIDGAGVFTHPQIIEDEFFNDEVLKNINFGAVYVNKEISDDKIMIDTEEKSSFGFSYESRQLKVFQEELIDTGLLSAIYANAAFMVNFTGSITADIDSEDYKLKRIDKNLFYSNPVKYISDLSDVIELLSFKHEDFIEEDSQVNTIQRIIPSLTIDTVSDISILQKNLDPRIINSVIISNLYAETEKGSSIGNILNPMLADLKAEMDRIEYKDDSFLRLILNDKADTRTWNIIPSRFYAAGILLSHIKTKPRELKLFEEFKKEKFMIDAEKDFEYFTASILSGKKIISENEINEIKSSDPQKWDTAYEQLKYMEYIVFNQFKQASQKLRSKGIKLIIKTNLMTLSGSTEVKGDYFESYNDGENVLLPQYNINPESFPFDEKLNFLKNNFLADGFLISNIDSYKGKEKVSLYLQKKFQSGLDKKMILIFEDDDVKKYPDKENVFMLTSTNAKNIIYKTSIEESTPIEEVLDVIKECEFEHINLPLSFSKDAGIKLESIKHGKKDIDKFLHSNPIEYYLKGLSDSIKNKKVKEEIEKLIISEEEENIHKVSAKGILIFNALYSYIKIRGTDGDLLLTYLSDSGALYSIAEKHLKLDKNSPIIRYIETLELKSKSSISSENKKLYIMQLIGFMNGIINLKYENQSSSVFAKVSALADSFVIKDNFFSYKPQEKDIKSLYGLYLGSKNKTLFATKLYRYFKNWKHISDDGKNINSLLWLIEQFSLFYNDLEFDERNDFSNKINPYINDILEHCKHIKRDSSETEALYLNALLVGSSINDKISNNENASDMHSLIDKVKEDIKTKYFSSDYVKNIDPDYIMFFALSALAEKEYFDSYRETVVENFKRKFFSEYGGIKSAKAYPYYIYYYLMLVPYSQREKSIETLSLYLEDNLCLPEYFSKKDAFSPAGEHRDIVSAAYFAMIFNMIKDHEVDLKVEKRDLKQSMQAIKNILGAA